MKWLQKTMKSSLIVAIIFAFISQAVADSKTGYFRIELTDKAHNQYNLDEPAEFLSERAIERRKKSNIEIDSADLPVSQVYKDSINRAGVEYRFDSRWFNYVIAGFPHDSIYDYLSGKDFVKEISLVKPFLNDEDSLSSGVSKSQLAFEPKTPARRYGESFTQIEQLNGHYLHEKEHKGAGKLIAVLDAGFPGVDHVEAFSGLREDGRIVGNYDFIRGEADVYADHPHGTNVLSIMAAELEDRFKGTAPDASYLLLRTEDAASEYRIEEHSWIAAAEYADSAGADIINSSLGYTIFDDSTMNYHQSDLDGETTWVARGAGKAVDRGILVVNSAGNSRRDQWGTLVSPADGSDVLSIGAIDAQENIANFSSPGYTADGRVAPSVVAMGSSTPFIGSNGDVYTGNGTSFSAPVISGMAASLWSAAEDRDSYEIRELIKDYAHLRDNPDEDMGYGIPNFFAMYRSMEGIEFEAPFEVEKAYPNPFNREIALELSADQNIEVKGLLTDSKGRKVIEKDFKIRKNEYKEVIFDGLENVASGLYHLRLIEGDEVFEIKFIKP